MRRLFLPAALLLFVFSACEKDMIDNTDKNFPIEIFAEQQGQLNALSWTKTNVSTFEEYLIVRAFDSIPPGQSPFSNFVIARFDDFEETSFVDNNASFEEEIFYKVYVDIGGRFLESPNLKIKQHILSYDFIAEKVIYDEVQNVFFLISLAEGKLSRFDVATNEITHSVLGFSSFKDFKVGTYSGKRELYVSSKSNGVISIFDATDLSLIDDFSIGQEVFALATNNRGLLFLSTEFDNDPLRVYSRADFTEKGAAGTSTFSTERLLTMLDASANEVLEATGFELFYYRFSEEGVLEEIRSNFSNSGTLMSHITISPDKQFFMPYRDGQVFNLNLDLEFFSGIFGNNVGSYAFDQNGENIAAGFMFAGFVQLFSFPEFVDKDFFDVSLDGVQFLFPFDDNKLIYIVGWRDFGFEQKSFIRTIQFPD